MIALHLLSSFAGDYFLTVDCLIGYAVKLLWIQ